MKLMAVIPMTLLLLSARGVPAQQKVVQMQAPAPPASTKTAPVHQDNRGQQVFDRNCSRCHEAPEGFSPRISRTVAMHMRIRASLSEAEYQALLQFLNP